MRHRFALSSVYDIPAYGASTWTRILTQNWHFTTIYQAQSGMPFTISVFGDTANSGTVLGENPIRANVTGEPIFGPGSATPTNGSIRRPSRLRRHYTFRRRWTGTRFTAPSADSGLRFIARTFRLSERTSFQFRGEAFNSLNKVNLGHLTAS